MSSHCFIPTWLQKTTAEDLRWVGMPGRRKSSKRRTTGPSENPMQSSAVDFYLLAKKHVSCALGSLPDVRSHPHVCSGTPQKPSKAQIRWQLTMTYSFASSCMSYTYVLCFSSDFFFCTRSPSILAYFFCPLTSIMWEQPDICCH